MMFANTLPMAVISLCFLLAEGGVDRAVSESVLAAGPSPAAAEVAVVAGAADGGRLSAIETGLDP